VGSLRPRGAGDEVGLQFIGSTPLGQALRCAFPTDHV